MDGISTKSTLAIVDDDPDDLLFIQDALEHATGDFQILPFASSSVFIDFLHTSETLPLMVVLDYNMPKLNAEDILISLKSTDRLASITAFILSTGMSDALKRRLISLGAHCCIAKPSSIDGYKIIAQDILQIAASLSKGSKPLSDYLI